MSNNRIVTDLRLKTIRGSISCTKGLFIGLMADSGKTAATPNTQLANLFTLMGSTTNAVIIANGAIDYLTSFIAAYKNGALHERDDITWKIKFAWHEHASIVILGTFSFISATLPLVFSTEYFQLGDDWTFGNGVITGVSALTFSLGAIQSDKALLKHLKETGNDEDRTANRLHTKLDIVRGVLAATDAMAIGVIAKKGAEQLEYDKDLKNGFINTSSTANSFIIASMFLNYLLSTIFAYRSGMLNKKQAIYIGFAAFLGLLLGSVPEIYFHEDKGDFIQMKSLLTGGCALLFTACTVMTKMAIRENMDAERQRLSINTGSP